LGAAEQPSGALWEPPRNQRLTKFPALSVNLLKIKNKKAAKTAAAKEKILASFSARSLWLFLSIVMLRVSP
jgi:hypothetical protein